MPGMRVRPGGRAASARAQPPVVSWSVSATTSRSAAAALAMSSAGVSVPSETEEWVCRSIRITGQPAAPRTSAPDELVGSPVLRGDRRERFGVLSLAGGRSRWTRPGPATVAAVVVAFVVPTGGWVVVPVEEQGADGHVRVLRVRHVGEVAQRLVLTGRFEPEGAVPE